jgi:hypothetical protein
MHQRIDAGVIEEPVRPVAEAPSVGLVAVVGVGRTPWDAIVVPSGAVRISPVRALIQQTGGGAARFYAVSFLYTLLENCKEQPYPWLFALIMRTWEG